MLVLPHEISNINRITSAADNRSCADLNDPEMIKESEPGMGRVKIDTPMVHRSDTGQPHPLLREALEKLRTRMLDKAVRQDTMLATTGESGSPSLRTIPIYDIDETGILFFVNGRSRHAAHLKQNQRAALCCTLVETGERLTVEGDIESTDRSVLNKWWDSRSREEQLLAWASNQSAPLDRLATLERRIAQCRSQFVDGAMPAPPHWIGFRLVPDRFEFIRPAQRHLSEWLCYKASGAGWSRTLLNP